MQIVLTANEMNVIESNFNTITEMAAPLFEISPEEMRQSILDSINDSHSFEVHFDGSLTINIPEDKVTAYFDILGSVYALAFKIAKIVKPTIELVMSECKEDFLALNKKIENF